MGVDLTRCWITWRILPLSRRTGLMCNYSGDSKDAQWFSPVNLEADDINKIVKKLLGESQEAGNKTGLSLFYALNPAPAVSTHIIICPDHQSLP
jgi:hypothetical protein